MREPKKKPNSRQMFEAVFEQQTRRFSAFDLLGLSADSTTDTEVFSGQDHSHKLPYELKHVESEKPPKTDSRFIPLSSSKRPHASTSDQKERLGLLTTLGPDHPLLARESSEYTSREKDAPGDRKRSRKNSLKVINNNNDLGQSLGPDRLALDQTVDPQYSGQTPPLHMGQTPPLHYGQTVVSKLHKEHGPDRLAHVRETNNHLPFIILAPLQWKVWNVLKESEAQNKITSYREISQITNSTIDGIRKAVIAIEKEGGIIEKRIIRHRNEQGLLFRLNKNVSFRKGSLGEAKAILKRGLNIGQTPDRPAQALGPDGLRMYVCISNIYIKHTDIVRLLKLTPESWKIREQTLVQIADLLPEMTAIEFRLSLSYLVEQAQQTKGPIRNPNAWLKAAFEKNQAPLITERDIEARFGRKDRKKVDSVPATPTLPVEANRESELFRFYLGCSAEVRADIDRIADQKAAPLLKVVTVEHQAGILAEARLEALRDFFSKKDGQSAE